MLPPSTLKSAIEQTAREEWGRILSALVKHFNDFQLAEDCLQDAILSAMDHWQRNGIPDAPAAWLITVAKRKALDRLRRDQNFAMKQPEISYLLDLENNPSDIDDEMHIPDKRLEMIFTCCHPALEEKSRVALTLRTLGGLTTEEIASAFLDKSEAMAQRLVRAKKKIAKAGIAYKVPDPELLPDRLASVLNVIYLVFNEGYSASKGPSITRADLCREAIRLARIVWALMPGEPEIGGLLALMLLHDSRRIARSATDGVMISLEEQNRLKWDKSKIEEGGRLLEQVLPQQKLGPYQLQAAIGAVHAQSKSSEETDWPQIEALYRLLFAVQPSPVIRINMAMAMSYARGCAEALQLLESANEAGKLEQYQPYHAAMADLLARMENTKQARRHFLKAIDLSDNESERQFLNQKLLAISGS